MMSNFSPHSCKRLVEPDVGGAERATAAGNEAQRMAGDEAGNPVGVRAVGQRHVVMHANIARPEPVGRAGQRPAAVVQQHEPLRFRLQKTRGELLQPVLRDIRPRLASGGADAQHLIGLANGLLRPGCQLGIGDIEHELMRAFERVQRLHGGAAVEIGMPAEHAAQIVGAHKRHRAELAQGRLEAGDEARRHGPRPRRDDGDRPRNGAFGHGATGGLIGEAPGQRRGERAPDGRGADAQPIELLAAKLEDEAVAGGGHRCCPHAAGEKGDLADGRARSDLGNGIGPAGDADVEAAGQNNEQGVRHVALAHQDAAAIERDRLQLALQGRALRRQEIAENGDVRKSRSEALRGHDIIDDTARISPANNLAVCLPQTGRQRAASARDGACTSGGSLAQWTPLRPILKPTS